MNQNAGFRTSIFEFAISAMGLFGTSNDYSKLSTGI